MFVSTGAFPSCSHMEMSLRCHIRQEKIFPSPRTLHQCWNPPSAAAFGSCDAETWLENTGRGLFPVFVLQILLWADLLSNLFVCGYVRMLWGGAECPPVAVTVTPLCRGSHPWAASAGAPGRCLFSQESDSKAHVWIFKQKALKNLPGKCNKNVSLKKICYQNDR